MSGDGCSSVCGLERSVLCGNSRLDENERCDDGGRAAGDGCGPLCEVERGFRCDTPGEACVRAFCGDSRLDSLGAHLPGGEGGAGGAGGAPNLGTIVHESCDDGDNDPGDGCDATCFVEPGWMCSREGMPCHRSVCGDGELDTSLRTGEGGAGGAAGAGGSGDGMPQREDCDDGNRVNGDGCSSGCAIEPGFTCDVSGECWRPACGNGIKDVSDGVRATETCDDSNTRSGDGCSATCQQEPGFLCPEAGRACRVSTCGDGVIDFSCFEECDDGNDAAGDGCRDCVIEGFGCDRIPGL